MTANFDQAKAIFLAAVERPPEKWDAYVAQACGDDADLKQGVEKLLKAHREGGSLFHQDDAGHAPTATYQITEAPGTIIGPYKLLEQIGEGGFGVVFMAEQQEPIRRKVALKVLKPGMDSRQVVARFEAERQALALMDHPNIAKVFDAGTTDTGRPFFVMELVRGVPITEYCDQVRMPPRQRLELFATVCQAIQHAHQKGIIHRDIKPSNVLVTEQDGKPLAKVIDFGIAKATGPQLTEKTLFTNFAAMIGTPMYMSPEQAGLSASDVDTRGDIYSLGVLLYELLTGLTPFDKERLKKSAYDEIRRIIREEDPPKPSTRLSDLSRPHAPREDSVTRSVTPTLASLSARRQTEPAKLTKLVRGELDWIVMKCLEKDRNRRYETANGLAMDLQRYLSDEPVLACPPSVGYRVRKFVGRHKRAAIAASAVFVSLVSGMIVATSGLLQADAARSDAVAAAEKEKQAKEAAEQVLQFVEERIIAPARPNGQEGGLGHDVTLRNALETALPCVSQSFTDQPLVEARLRRTMGLSFRYLGDEKTAAEQFEAAQKLYSQHLGPNHSNTLAVTNNLANSYAVLGRLDESLNLREETLELRKAELGPDHEQTLDSMSNLALSYQAAGRFEDALRLHEETLAGRRAKFGDSHPHTLASMNNLGICYTLLGRHADAVKLHEETLSLMKARFRADHPNVMACMHNLAQSYAARGRYADALKLYEETLDLAKQKLTDEHPNTLLVMNNIAWLLATAEDADFRDPARAVELAERSTRLSPNNAEFWGTLGAAHCRAGDWKQAVADLEKAIGLRGVDDPQCANEAFFLAMAHWQRCDETEARKWFDKGTVWTETGKFRQDQVRRFQAEAAGMMRIEEKESKRDAGD